MKVEIDDEVRWIASPACGRCSVDGCEAIADGYLASSPDDPRRIALCGEHRADVERVVRERLSRSS